MHELNIDVICANTPAAKGRVERAHQTLQDRLVKELRLRGISDRDGGNAFLEEFREDYNRRFARVPKNARDAHRVLLAHEDLLRVFSWQEDRRLTQNLTLHYERVMYVVDSTPASEKARGKRVSLRDEQDGTVRIEYQGVELQARAFPKDARVHQGAIVDNKLLGHTLSVIAAAQRERDEHRLNTERLTLRDEDLLRKAMGQPGLPTRRPRARKPPVQSSEAPLAPTFSYSQPLAHALAWAEQLARTGDPTVPELDV